MPYISTAQSCGTDSLCRHVWEYYIWYFNQLHAYIFSISSSFTFTIIEFGRTQSLARSFALIYRRCRIHRHTHAQQRKMKSMYGMPMASQQEFPCVIIRSLNSKTRTILFAIDMNCEYARLNNDDDDDKAPSINFITIFNWDLIECIVRLLLCYIYLSEFQHCIIKKFLCID